MRIGLIVGVLLAGCSSGGNTPAQAPSAPVLPAATELTGSPAAPRTQVFPSSDPILLMTGDLLHVSVFRQKELELDVRISDSGSFSFPMIGEVQAAGRTSIEVERDICARLGAKYIYNPSVTVTPTQFASRAVFALGGLMKPGGYEIAPGRRLTLLQLISWAGGFSDRAYKEYGQLLRRKPNGERDIISFSVTEVEKAVARGQAGADTDLVPGDLLIIPSGARVIYVLGQVNKPGSFDLPVDTRITVSMAISQAGSWTKYASIGRIQVLRQPPSGDPQKFVVNLDEVAEGKPKQDLELAPGDVVWVPQRSIF